MATSVFELRRALLTIAAAGVFSTVFAADVQRVDLLPAKDSEASTESEMRPYTDLITHAEVKFEMVPIPGGEFLMGSPETEIDRKADEGPQRKLKISPFWMGKYEVTWDEYGVFMEGMDTQLRSIKKTPLTILDKNSDLVARPTIPYVDMAFGMGKDRYPAICMTQYAAKKYCEWLSAKTGRYYRLPTEAEWEYACRAGSTTAYSFGDDPDFLGEYAWYYDNSKDKTQKVGQKKANAWGLHDMHGNVAEWCLDQYDEKAYEQTADGTLGGPFVPATKTEPRVVRGGGFDSFADEMRSASRQASTEDWKEQDPNFPRSVWYYTDAKFLGFRIIRPLTPAEGDPVRYGVDAVQKKDQEERLPFEKR